jgi:GNAT superfamily N-acetyltransferase
MPCMSACITAEICRWSEWNIEPLVLNMTVLNLPDGYHLLPNGKLVNVVTYLEMLTPPIDLPSHIKPPFRLVPLDCDDLEGYRALYREVGEEWMWVSRTVMGDKELRTILNHPGVEVFALCEAEARLGLLELDFREPGQCELAFFGLKASAIGRGFGRVLMDEGARRAWVRPIQRFWVHTCTFDSPKALAFYIRSGFTPYARGIEIHDDPRINGKLPRTAATHIPIIE